MIINILIIVAIILGIWYLSKKYIGSLDKLDMDFEEEDTEIDFKYLMNEVTNYFSLALKKRYDDENLTRDELLRKTKQTAELRTAITNAKYGDKDAKRTIKNYIKDLLGQSKYGLKDGIDLMLPVYSPEKLNVVNDKFEILLYMYTKKYGDKAFSKLMDEYDFTKPFVDSHGEQRYALTRELMDAAYEHAIIDKNDPNLGRNVEVTYNDKLEILTQKVYEKTFGFGAIDAIRETNVDEIDVGVSGIPAGGFTIKTEASDMPYSYESIWVVYHGLNIKLECCSFETQEELVRVCNNIYKYDAPYVMSRSEGRVVSTMIDGSRIVVCRPPFAESYSFFLRKFDSAPGVAPAEIINEGNKYLPICFMKWFIRGQRNVGITGSQGTGKTTMLKALIRYIDSSFNLRIQELMFELNLRFAYPNRNIETFQETANISAQEGLNLQKKTNGTVNIIGEVASAIQASHIIQTAMVASLFAMFTHHAKTAADWVNAIADNLLQIGLYKDKKDAVRVTAKVLNIDCHLANIRGHRYIERITEVIPASEQSYPSNKFKLNENGINVDGLNRLSEANKNYKDAALMDAPEFFKRMTDPELFTTQDIIRWQPYDVPKEINENGKIRKELGEFVFVNMPSEAMISDMKTRLSLEEIEEFDRDMEMIKALSNGERPDGVDEWIEMQLAS